MCIRDRPYSAPMGIIDVAFFGASPAGVSVVARSPDDAAGLDFADHFHDFFKVVVFFRVTDIALFPGSSVIAVSSVGSVKPDFKDRPVIGQQFPDLFIVCLLYTSSLSFSQRRGPCTSLLDCFQNWISHMFRLYHPLPGMACSRGESPVT